MKRYWDPANYFVSSKMPTLWVNGDKDAHFSVNITSKSAQLISKNSNISIHHAMPHGHSSGWLPSKVPEIYTFVDLILRKNGNGLASITKQPKKSKKLKLTYTSTNSIEKAIVYYLKDKLLYEHKKNQKHPITPQWKTYEATIKGNKVIGNLPIECKTYYVNLIDSKGNIISSNLIELE